MGTHAEFLSKKQKGVRIDKKSVDMLNICALLRYWQIKSTKTERGNRIDEGNKWLQKNDLQQRR